MNNIKNEKEILEFIKTKSKKSRKKFLTNCTNETVREIVEILANFLHGRIKVKSKALQKIRYHKSKIRKLSKTRSYKKAKNYLVQTGGWAGILVPLLLSIGSSLTVELLNEIHK